MGSRRVGAAKPAFISQNLPKAGGTAIMTAEAPGMGRVWMLKVYMRFFGDVARQ
jgi:hypothetical protein